MLVEAFEGLTGAQRNRAPRRWDVEQMDSGAATAWRMPSATRTAPPMKLRGSIDVNSRERSGPVAAIGYPGRRRAPCHPHSGGRDRQSAATSPVIGPAFLMSDGADLDQLAGLTESDGVREALQVVPSPTMFEWPSLGSGHDRRDGVVDALTKSVAMSWFRSRYRLAAERSSCEALGWRKKRSGATDDAVEFLSDLGPGLQLHGT
jgi:hypothetical protein